LPPDLCLQRRVNLPSRSLGHYRLIDPGSDWRLLRQWSEQSAMVDARSSALYGNAASYSASLANTSQRPTARELGEELTHFRNRAARAEDWLARIHDEVEQAFFQKKERQARQTREERN
jgi:hypothetical protein